MTSAVTGNVEDGTTLALSAYEEQEHYERKQEQDNTHTFMNKKENDYCKKNDSRSSKKEDSVVVDIDDYDNGDKYEAGEDECNIDDEDESHSCIDESTVLVNMTCIKDKQTKWQRWFGLHKMSKSQQRTCLILSLCIVCGLLLFIFIGIPFIVLNALNHSKDLQNADTEDSVGAEWNDIMIKAIVNGRAVLDTFHAYVQSLMSEMPLTNEAVTTELIQKTTNVVMKRFGIVSGLVLSTILYASEVQIAPRGILTIIRPLDPIMYNQNMFNESNSYFAIPPTPWEVYEKGTLTYIGPYKPNAGNEDDIWSLQLTQPVFNTSNVHNHSNSSFWGFVNLYLNVSMVFKQYKLTEYMKLYNVDYMFVSYGVNNTNVPVATSLPTPLTEEDINEFILTSHSTGQFHKEVNFTLYVRSRNTHHYLDATNVSCVIAISFFLVCVVFFFGVWLILNWTKEYDGRVYAPKMPPFALLTIGSSHAEELWNLVPMAMAETMDRLNHLQDTYMEQYKAYKINQLHPYTTSFVLRSMESAIAMGFAILATLQEQHESSVNYSHVHFGSKSVSCCNSDNNNNVNGKDNKPIIHVEHKKFSRAMSNESEHVDAPLRELLGEEDGVLLLNITIHWCTDAYVSVETEGIQDPITITYCYDGKDIKVASAMNSYAASNTLTLSLEALSQVQRNVKLSQLTAAPHLEFMRVDRKGEKLPLFLLTDPSSQYLVNARNVATKRESINYTQRLSLLYLSKYKHQKDKEKSGKHQHHHRHHRHKQKQKGHGDANPKRNKNYLCSVEGIAFASEVSSLPIPIISSSSEHEQTSSSSYLSSSESFEESSSSGEFSFHHNPHRHRRISNNYTSSTTSTTRTTTSSSLSLSSFTSKSKSSHSISHSSSYSSSTTSSTTSSSTTTTTTTSTSASTSLNSLSVPRGNNANANTSLSAEHNPLDYYVGHLRTQPPPPPPKSSEVLLEREEEEHSNNKDIRHENHNGEENEMKNCSSKEKKKNTSLQRHSTHVTSELLDVESINFKKEEEEEDNTDKLPVQHLYSQSTMLTAETLNSPSSAISSEQTQLQKSEIVNEKKKNKDSQMEMKNNFEYTIIKYHKNKTCGNIKRYSKEKLVNENEINIWRDENMQSNTVNSKESNYHPQNTDTVTTQIYREVVINNKNKNNEDDVKKTNQELKDESLHSIEHVKSKKKKHKSKKHGKLHHRHQHHQKDKRKELIKQIKSKKVNQECLMPEADALTYLLIHPSIDKAINSFLRHAFEHQSIAMEISYESVRVMVYYFYCSFKLLFRPLAVPERNNLYRRFITAFGVPMKGILYHLAARCTIRYLQQQQEQNDMHYALRPPHYTVSRAFSNSASMSKSDDDHHNHNHQSHHVSNNDDDSKVVNKSISQELSEEQLESKL